MKKIYIILGLVLIGSGWMIPVSAIEKIDLFDSEITINDNATVVVTERIDYDFGQLKRHGIYRTIPVRHKVRGGNYRIKISDIKVTDESDTARQFEQSRVDGDLKIKIGDPDQLITGKQTYVIRYTVKRAINYFSNHDELYWNVTGNEWPVPIGTANVKIVLPNDAGWDSVTSDCWVGFFGSKETCMKGDFRPEVPAVSYHAPGVLEASDGMTIVVGWPKGVVHEPTWLERLVGIAKDNWVVAVPLIALLYMVWLWRRKGRDPKGRGSIPPQFEPPAGLTPSQVGTVIDEKADQVDLTADVIYLAVSGHLRIEYLETKKLLGKKKDYRLIRLENSGDLETEHEKLLFNKLFDGEKKEIKLSDLKNEFYKDWTAIKSKIYESVVEKGYFVRNPQKVRQGYVAGGVIIAVVGGMVGGLWLGVIAGISWALTGGLIALFGLIMPVRTKQGVLIKEYILGLKRYLSVAEKERLKFHNAPAKKPEYFDQLLPYAMVLGVEKEWAAQFADIYKDSPEWYSGPAGLTLML